MKLTQSGEVDGRPERIHRCCDDERQNGIRSRQSRKHVNVSIEIKRSSVPGRKQDGRTVRWQDSGDAQKQNKRQTQGDHARTQHDNRTCEPGGRRLSELRLALSLLRLQRLLASSAAAAASASSSSLRLCALARMRCQTGACCAASRARQGVATGAATGAATARASLASATFGPKPRSS